MAPPGSKQRQSVMNEYIERARIRKTAELEEQTAGQTSEATGLVNIINRLREEPGQPLIYYTGALELLRLRLRDPVSRTLFRSSGGFELSSSHVALSRCLDSSPSCLTDAELTLTAVYVGVMRDACHDDADSQCHVLAMRHLPQQLMTFIESAAEMPRCHDVASACVDLLLYLSQSSINRSQIVVRYDSTRLITAAFTLAQHLSPCSQLALNSQRLICNLATSDQLRRHLRPDFEQTVLASFNALLASASLADTLGGTLCVNTMVNLCGDARLRRAMSTNDVTWSAAVSALAGLTDQSRQLACSLLSLLANMAIDGTVSAAQCDLVQLCVLCTDLLTQFSANESVELVDKCYLLLSRVLKLNADCVHAVVTRGFITAASRDLACLLSHQPRAGLGPGAELVGIVKHCVCAVTACTLHSSVGRRELIDSCSPPIIGLLMDVLLSHSEDEDDELIGNTALCLSNCITESSAAVRHVTSAARDRDVIMTLLVLARDQAKPTVQHNCAVLIARLVRGHTPYLARLRELHGVEILHTVLTHFTSRRDS